MSCQVEFLETSLRVISVPRNQYSSVFLGIVRLYLKTWKLGQQEHERPQENVLNDNTQMERDLPSSGLETFLNISLTPCECSIICHSRLADHIFSGKLKDLEGVRISDKEYTALKVDGESFEENSRRILAISEPLSRANISIFFMSAYFSDYVLVPSSMRKMVEDILQKSGYRFSSIERSYLSQRSSSGETTPQDSGGVQTWPESPHLAPETMAHELPYGVTPTVAQNVELVLTGARPNCNSSEVDLCVLRTLSEPPGYFALTLHHFELSLLMESGTVSEWPQRCLLGSLSDFVVPIEIGLRGLPLELVGVVACVAKQLLKVDISMSFLSSAQGSLVLISSEDRERALLELEGVSSAESSGLPLS